MKKVLIFFLIVGLAIGGYVLYHHESVPESKRILEEMHKVLEGNESDYGKVAEFEDLQKKLLDAYLKEKQYDLAIGVLEQQIEKTRSDGERNRPLFNGRRPSASYNLEATQLDMLAMIYEREQDTDRAAKAKTMAGDARIKAENARKAEPR